MHGLNKALIIHLYVMWAIGPLHTLIIQKNSEIITLLFQLLHNQNQHENWIIL